MYHSQSRAQKAISKDCVLRASTCRTFDLFREEEVLDFDRKSRLGNKFEPDSGSSQNLVPGNFFCIRQENFEFQNKRAKIKRNQARSAEEKNRQQQTLAISQMPHFEHQLSSGMVNHMPSMPVQKVSDLTKKFQRQVPPLVRVVSSEYSRPNWSNGRRGRVSFHDDPGGCSKHVIHTGWFEHSFFALSLYFRQHLLEPRKNNPGAQLPHPIKSQTDIKPDVKLDIKTECHSDLGEFKEKLDVQGNKFAFGEFEESIQK